MECSLLPGAPLADGIRGSSVPGTSILNREKKIKRALPIIRTIIFGGMRGNPYILKLADGKNDPSLGVSP